MSNSSLETKFIEFNKGFNFSLKLPVNSWPDSKTAAAALVVNFDKSSKKFFISAILFGLLVIGCGLYNKLIISEKYKNYMTEKVTSQQLQSVIDKFSDINLIKGINHPDINPVFFEFYGFELRWYSLAYLAGILLGYFLATNLSKNNLQKPIGAKALENLPLWVILSIILGGRLGYVLFYNFEYYYDNPSKIIQIWNGGMAFHGGVIGVILGLFLFSKFYKEQFLKITDVIAIVCPIGLFLGRMANFVNKELVGRECDLSWCIIYPDEPFARYPSQLFEAATEGLLLFVIMIILAKKFNILAKTGLASALFLMLYAVFRFVCEFFREPDVQLGFIVEKITMGQILSVAMFVIGLVVLKVRKIKV